MPLSQPSQPSQDERKSRFAHLLQPIRDLTENWNIDIAAELEEYLHEARCPRKYL